MWMYEFGSVEGLAVGFRVISDSWEQGRLVYKQDQCSLVLFTSRIAVLMK
jgi:phage head maturation protease